MSNIVTRVHFIPCGAHSGAYSINHSVWPTQLLFILALPALSLSPCLKMGAFYRQPFEFFSNSCFQAVKTNQSDRVEVVFNLMQRGFVPEEMVKLERGPN